MRVTIVEFDSFCEAYGCFEMYTVIIISTFGLIQPRLFILPETTDTSVAILLQLPLSFISMNHMNPRPRLWHRI